MSQFFLDPSQVLQRAKSSELGHATDSLSRLLALRGENCDDPNDSPLKQLLHPNSMLGLQRAAQLLADIQGQVCVVADYDCDGATACAVIIRGLRVLRPDLRVNFIVPDRRTDGYGLSAALVDKLRERFPHCTSLITVDNGIASIAGISHAKALGLTVIVTDHHLPGKELPPADAIVNPNQLGCGFASKNLAGVGVAFYLMIALRAELRSRADENCHAGKANLQHLCDLVALGTVADLVPLDRNNRLLVKAGMTQLQQGSSCVGLEALLSIAKCSSGATIHAKPLTSKDLAFLIAPRINAAGRLADMRTGIECLIEDDVQKAYDLALELDTINQSRKALQAAANDQALAGLMKGFSETQDAPVIVYFDQTCHEGIVGLIAGKLKETFYRPAFAFARAEKDGVLKGSGRSVEGLHLRDLLDEISKRDPSLLLTFGGHAMAAGVSLLESNLTCFSELANELVKKASAQHADSPLNLTVSTDGSGEFLWSNWNDLLAIEQQIWGQAFLEPLFDDEFVVHRQELIKGKHTKLWVSPKREPSLTLNAIRFFGTEGIPSQARLLYRVQPDRFGAQRHRVMQASLEVLHCVN